MSLRTAATTALAAAAGALLLGAAGAASPAQAAPQAAPDAPATSSDGVALVKQDTVTPWSLTDFLLGSGN
ncbi:hypothetical protein [Streptomyces sp. enrichment culture]|uniref:hypothetical protein n=1 Tax=Streptomyces sp. enrichment culture TaxID=1795815 RepID=UPI003F574B41